LLVRTLEIFQGTHILGASHGRLCDSSDFLFLVSSVKLFVRKKSAFRPFKSIHCKVID